MISTHPFIQALDYYSVFWRFSSNMKFKSFPVWVGTPSWLSARVLGASLSLAAAGGSVLCQKVFAWGRRFCSMLPVTDWISHRALALGDDWKKNTITFTFTYSKREETIIWRRWSPSGGRRLAFFYRTLKCSIFKCLIFVKNCSSM